MGSSQNVSIPKWFWALTAGTILLAVSGAGFWMSWVSLCMAQQSTAMEVIKAKLEATTSQLTAQALDAKNTYEAMRREQLDRLQVSSRLSEDIIRLQQRLQAIEEILKTRLKD